MEPEYSDEVKRFHDGITLHLLADIEQARNSWVAVRLDTGAVSTDLFDERSQAIAHQAKDYEFFYIFIPPTGITLREAEAVLRVNRELASQGMRMGTEKEFVPPTLNEDLGAPALITPNRARLIKMLYVMENFIAELPPGSDRNWWESEHKRIKGIIHG